MRKYVKYVAISNHIHKDGDITSQCLGIFPNVYMAIGKSFDYLSSFIEDVEKENKKVKISAIYNFEPDDSGFMFTAEFDDRDIEIKIYYIDEEDDFCNKEK